MTYVEVINFDCFQRCCMDYENNKPALTQGWRAIELANQVFSFNGWSCSIVDLHQDFVRALRLSANKLNPVKLRHVNVYTAGGGAG